MSRGRRDGHNNDQEDGYKIEKDLQNIQGRVLTVNLARLKEIDKKTQTYKNLDEIMDLTLSSGKLFTTQIEEVPIVRKTRELAEVFLDMPFPNNYTISKKCNELMNLLVETEAFSWCAEDLHITKLAFAELVYSFWFQMYEDYHKHSNYRFYYTRCGFLHTVLGDWVAGNREKISGMHSWYGLYLREKRGEVKVDHVEYEKPVLVVTFSDPNNPENSKRSTMLFPQTITNLLCSSAYVLVKHDKPLVMSERHHLIIKDLARNIQSTTAVVAGHIITAFSSSV